VYRGHVGDNEVYTRNVIFSQTSDMESKVEKEIILARNCILAKLTDVRIANKCVVIVEDFEQVNFLLLIQKP
jgi:hypothetical protein